jgi:prophage regulatory protein
MAVEITGEELSRLGDRLITVDDVLAKTGLSSSMLYRRLDDGTFPKLVSIGKRGIRWRLSEIDEWMKNLAPFD